MFKTYNELIDFAKSEWREKGGSVYYELHHILPHFMGGKEEKNNKVLLTIGEHVLAHYLLALENENINKQYYIGNINAAWQIIHGKSKFSSWKRLKLEEWLKDPDAQKLSEEVKIKFKENLKLNPNLKGKSLKDGSLKPISSRIWVYYNHQKPVRILEKNFGKGTWIKYSKMESCPICKKENSLESFACCKEHEELYLKQNKEYMTKVHSETLKREWGKNKEKKIESISKPHKNFNHCWITKNGENKSVSLEDLRKYELDGWTRGRVVEGHPATENQKKLISERRKNTCYVHNEEITAKEIKKTELDSYIRNGWFKGRA